jgi:hypothetical protein
MAGMGTFAETGAEPPALGAEPPALGAEPPALGAESVTAAVDCVGADDGRAGSNVLDGDAASGFIQPRAARHSERSGVGRHPTENDCLCQRQSLADPIMRLQHAARPKLAHAADRTLG